MLCGSVIFIPREEPQSEMRTLVVRVFESEPSAGLNEMALNEVAVKSSRVREFSPLHRIELKGYKVKVFVMVYSSGINFLHRELKRGQ